MKHVENHSFNLAKNIPMQATLHTPKFFIWLSLSLGDRVTVLVTKKQDNTNKNKRKTSECNPFQNLMKWATKS